MELTQIKYKVYCNFDLSVNNYSLNFLYLPIIEANAYSLYNWLANEIHLQRSLFKIKSNHERIFLALQFDEDTFQKARANLEAMGLLITRVMHSGEQNEVYVYELVAPLSFEEFISNLKYKSLLINRITLLEFERLSLAFQSGDAKQGYNISSTFEMVYDEPTSSEALIDSKALVQSLSEILNQKVVINQEIICIMETFHRVYNLSTEKMKNVLGECVLAKDGDCIFFDISAFRKKLSAIAESMTKKNDPRVELRRNIQIFDNTVNEIEKNEIINDYLTLNCEQYLAGLQKNELTPDQHQLLAYLKKKQNLPDSVINLLLDYSVYHTYGRINENYLKKLARSINVLNLKTVHDVLHYFQQLTLGVKHIDFYPTMN